MPNTASARSEVRQFLMALAGLAFVLSTLGTSDTGPRAFAADIVLVLCGAWCANQLIRGPSVFKEQAICVLQAYFIGLFCCSIALFIVGWMVFLPSEYVHLGHSLMFAATFTTNFELAFLPTSNALRFDGVFDHLWVPALIAQSCAILIALYWVLHRNTRALLLVLSLTALASLAISAIDAVVVHLLPVGQFWTFLCGAIPFFAANRYPVLRHALLLGIINLLAGVLTVSVSGDTIFARIFFALGVSFLYLGSRQHHAPEEDTTRRRRWFGMALHMFLWMVPLAQVTAALDIVNPDAANYTALIIPCVLLSIMSWSIWQRVEQTVHLSRVTPSALIAGLLLASGVIALTGQGLQMRYPETAKAYIHAIDAASHASACPTQTDGPLAGLAVCQVGRNGPPTVLVWGDHQLRAMHAGIEEAARRADVSALVIANSGCIPLGGLQTRLTDAKNHTGRSCDQYSAQVLQALPHLDTIRHVTLVADWLHYTGNSAAEFKARAPVRLGPVDGTPIDTAHQFEYIETAARQTIETLLERGVHVSVIRQVPAQPGFDAEIAARAAAPGHWLYRSMPEMSDFVPQRDAANRQASVDRMFGKLAATGRVRYVDTWPVFCSEARCDARGGLSSDYVSSTRLTPSGALSLSPTLAADFRRARTHGTLRPAHDS
ncbi:SGNH hydrolase domain-containing protein [Marivita sp. S2033]|uniref:SGNH hydrolase domain-containing protein n=1 Tax=Marivita sp. S2033 TaxID=3373187 RepID=UPI003981B020